ncbi:Cold shock protein, CspA family [Halopseudomonas yangmingensis]|uniref:Cold shock protein, CspA family n=2 Tax=Halopseudomonas yangmingensis TaxID=1720063 RepID=A0A1I4NGM2_9GAMM|nr:Cold shock protein, CspA family [Halopseudomonas yangmingensis]
MTIRHITLLAAGLGSLTLGLCASFDFTPANGSAIALSGILAGLLCLQNLLVRITGGSPRSAQLAGNAQALLLILGALGPISAALDLAGSQVTAVLAFAALLSALGVCTGLVWSSIPQGSQSTTPRSARTSTPREQGMVKWFNSSKGFGFISRDGQSDVFVHFRSLRDPDVRSLNEGERVEFLAVPNDKGVQAEDVILLDIRIR